MNLLRVFIGLDPRQPLAYQVAAHSIARNSSRPVSITPLILSQLPLKRRGLTEFTFSRYLVPYLCGYEGHALFVDADILCMGDIAELPWDSHHAVSVVSHDNVTLRGQQVDVRFERPSVMLFNCHECEALTLDLIETGTPQKLQTWAQPHGLSIGELPPAWNFLVGYDDRHRLKFSAAGALEDHRVKLAHFTMGIPVFPETCNDEYAAEYRAEIELMNSTVSWAEIMGGSVHAKWKEPLPVKKFMSAQGFR